MRRAPGALGAILLAVLLLPAGAAQAQEPGALSQEDTRESGAIDYAYFTLQGRLTDPSLRKALEGATIRLTSGDQSFETVTDRKGVFQFEKLPVTSFTVDVISSDGRVVRGIRRLDANDPVRPRLRIDLGKGTPQSFQVNAAEEAISLDVPEPEIRWDRFWKELGIFVGVAAILAL